MSEVTIRSGGFAVAISASCHCTRFVKLISGTAFIPGDCLPRFSKSQRAYCIKKFLPHRKPQPQAFGYVGLYIPEYTSFLMSLASQETSKKTDWARKIIVHNRTSLYTKSKNTDPSGPVNSITRISFKFSFQRNGPVHPSAGW